MRSGLAVSLAVLLHVIGWTVPSDEILHAMHASKMTAQDNLLRKRAHFQLMYGAWLIVFFIINIKQPSGDTVPMKPGQDGNPVFDDEGKISSAPIGHSGAGLLDESPRIGNEDGVLLDQAASSILSFSIFL